MCGHKTFYNMMLSTVKQRSHMIKGLIIFQKFLMMVWVAPIDWTVQRLMLYALLANVLVIVQDSTKAVKMPAFSVSL